MNNPKFRLWDDKNKKWLLGYEYSNLGGFSMFGECMLMGEYSDAISDINNWENLILTQYSGLNDINVQEIYEGDIVKKPSGDWGVIVYKAPFFEVTVSDTQSCMYSREWFNDIEIIGNIFDNPELIKNDK